MDVGPRCSFVIFGITGDLAARKLVPALYALHVDGALHPETAVVGFARSAPEDDAELRERLGEVLREHVDEIDDDAWNDLATRIVSVRGGYDEDGFARLKERLDALDIDDHVYYTSTPPEAYTPIVHGLAGAGLTRSERGYRRIVVEKPFGHDLDSAVELNAALGEVFDEDQIYRIDHYLAKETAQNLAVLRFANALFEPIWSNRYVDHVQITMVEPMGMEGRGAFYEQAGVVRDVFQNHLLQLLALVAMEPPARYDADAVRDEKVKVLRATDCLDPSDVVLGQYVAADDMPGYREEEGVAADSRVPTFAAAAFTVRTWRWAGVPFYVRAGKRLEGKASEIVLRLKQPPHQPFTELAAAPKADRLVLRLVPDEGIALRFNAKVPGQGIALDRVNLGFTYREGFEGRVPDAYETLLSDVITGDATLFMRADEVEAQWRVVAPLLAPPEVDPEPYPAGSPGPLSANTLLERDGRDWHKPGGI
jgi:glucose-6-phosphate 1-dehydrogenase